MNKLEKISNKLELPSEIIFNLPIIKIIGKEIITVQNYKQIIQYLETSVRLKEVIIEGENLIITKIDKEQIEIKGVIKACEII